MVKYDKTCSNFLVTSRIVNQWTNLTCTCTYVCAVHVVEHCVLGYIRDCINGIATKPKRLKYKRNVINILRFEYSGKTPKHLVLKYVTLTYETQR